MTDRSRATGVAFSLTSEELRNRRTFERDKLLPVLTASAPVDKGIRLTFRDTVRVRAIVSEFVGLERQCCGFLSFAVTSPEEGVVLSITGPPEAEPILSVLRAALDTAQ